MNGDPGMARRTSSRRAHVRRSLSPRSLRALSPSLLLLLFGCAPESHSPVVPAIYHDVVARLATFIEAEMARKELDAISIALVDDQSMVWSAGFGEARPGVPASGATVHRVGSVSKLFTDIAIMQRVEAGQLDLDAPVTNYLPAFAPENPFGEPITLRQLMSHRAGLVREPPVGHYFDADEPDLARTVASLNETRLVHAAGSRTKYSNAGIAVVGRVFESVAGAPFADALEQAVLRPIGMTRSSFAPRPDITADLATATMWAYDGRSFEAPGFQLGMAPAGSMYSTVDDLARFLSVLFNGGQGSNGRVLSAESIETMWTPQFAQPGARTGYGIGFNIGGLDGHRSVGHGGAIYGFATELAALPDEKIGVAVVTTTDIANIVSERIASYALRLMLAARSGTPLPDADTTTALPPEIAASLEGRWQGRSVGIDLLDRRGRLYLTPLRGGFRTELRARGDTLIADDRLAFGMRVIPAGDVLVMGGDTLQRVERTNPPAPPPAAWNELIGEYGWDHNTLYILERDGQLNALIEWFFLYPLTHEGGDVYRFPGWGLYDNERLTFTRDASGRVTQVSMEGVVFPRRDVGTAAGETFRITPVRPVAELRAEALAAAPPAESGTLREPDLVELNSLDPTIRYDIRYATTNNFMSEVFYTEPHAFLQRPAAEGVLRAHQQLGERGYGLLIHDAYRPWHVTRMFWDATPQDMKQFVADPSQGSRHNRGAAVDLTLYDRSTGEVIQTVGGYDEFSSRSYPDYPGGTSRQRWFRELLRDVMEANGFTVYEWEWWHFDFDGWREYPVLNRAFEELGGSGGGD
jgi:CubicO group peptidase (beta-lactamase class C family)/D-alanyl-D-alanine dipeptidase